MERYTLQKRIVLSFETKKDEDGDVDYTYIVDAYFFLPFYSCSSVNRDESMVVVTLSSGSIRFLTTTDFSVIHSIETGHTNILCTRFIQCAASIVVICYQSLLVTFFHI